MSADTPPLITWPKPYLLRIYQLAFERGFLYVGPFESQASSVSFRQAFVRLRRRIDSSNKTFITPEHFLVSVGPWDPATSKLSVIYNQLPDGMTLPKLSTDDGEELALPELPPPAEVPAFEPSALTPEELALEPEEVHSFVQQLAERARKRREGANR